MSAATNGNGNAAAPSTDSAKVKVEPAVAAAAAAPAAAAAAAPAADAAKDVKTVDDDALAKRIREILKTVNLDTFTAKQLRTQLEVEFQTDMSARKAFINDVLGKGLAEISAAAAAAPAADGKKGKAAKQPKAKPEPVKELTQEEKDHALAMEMAGGGGGRPRRGAAADSYKKAEKRRQKDEDRATKPKVQRKKRDPPVISLSPALAEFCGTDRMTRGDVTKKVWEHIRAHNLQVETDKRMIRVDAKLRTIFGDKAKTIQMFKMTKKIAAHMKRADQLVGGGGAGDDDDDDDGEEGGDGNDEDGGGDDE